MEPLIVIPRKDRALTVPRTQPLWSQNRGRQSGTFSELLPVGCAEPMATAVTLDCCTATDQPRALNIDDPVFNQVQMLSVA